MASRLRIILFGEADALRSLLVDLLRDSNVEAEFLEPGAGRPDVVFAVVRTGDVFGVVELALRASRGAQVVAVMALSDPRVALRARLAGAHAICALDGPLGALRRTLERALERQALLRDAEPVR
ncbi:MAG: hypothetical protein JNK82_29820 [Myxococcaceae bacterium]|nr:hypothetical protein [Myxococcaceae bacterium]